MTNYKASEIKQQRINRIRQRKEMPNPSGVMAMFGVDRKVAEELLREAKTPDGGEFARLMRHWPVRT